MHGSLNYDVPTSNTNQSPLPPTHLNKYNHHYKVLNLGIPLLQNDAFVTNISRKNQNANLEKKLIGKVHSIIGKFNSHSNVVFDKMLDIYLEKLI